MDASTLRLSPPWDSTVQRVVEYRFFQRKSVSVARTLALTARGIELSRVDRGNGPTVKAAAAAASRAHEQVIPWTDILGASVLSTDSVAHVPKYKPTATSSSPAIDPQTDFVVFGCIPKADLVNAGGLVDGFRALMCLAGGDDLAVEVDGTEKKSETTKEAEKKTTAAAGKQCDRVLVQWVFRYSADDATAFVPQLVEAIQELADPRSRPQYSVGSHADQAEALPRRKFLVLVNPVGGKGNATQLYQSLAAPIFTQSNIDCKVVVTEYQHHATEIATNLPLSVYDCVVAVGGDGLLSEVLQGLMKRSDWEAAITQPLGVLPAGSGNGLSCSLLARSGESFDLLNAVFALVKGCPHEMDIASVINSKEDVMYSFLSFTWTFMADVDIDSEKYRMFGGMRFMLSAAIKLLSKHKTYTGRVRYLAASEEPTATRSAGPPKYHERVRDPLNEEEDGGDGVSRPTMACFAALAQQEHGDQDGITKQQEWRELSGPFHVFSAMNVSHAAADCLITPAAAIADGYFHLVVLEGEFSRLNLAKVVLAVENGSHIGMDKVQVIRTRAFSLQFDNPEDRMCVDGERFDSSEIKVEVHRALARVVCLPPKLATASQ